MPKHFSALPLDVDADDWFECELCRDWMERCDSSNPDRDILLRDSILICEECREEYEDSFAPDPSELP